MAYPARALKAFELRQDNPFQQFGQTGDAYSAQGSVGCAFTVLQYLILLWKGRWYTHDQLAKIAQFPNQSLIDSRVRRGLRVYEIERIIAALRLPYKVVFHLTATQVRAHAKNGPVAYGMAYGWAPEWRGYRYAGLLADGRPNGFAYSNGKTQLAGFTGAHLMCLLGEGISKSGVHAIVRFDPNHGSPARPERPPYDTMSPTQFSLEYASYTRVLGRSPYAIVPLQALPL